MWRNGNDTMSEAAEQKALCEWLTARGVLFKSTPNEGKRSYKTARHLKSMGMKKGFPDLTIISVPAYSSNQGITCVAIEMKAPGKKPTKEQDWWLYELQKHGWATGWFTSFEDAQEWLQKLGY